MQCLLSLVVVFSLNRFFVYSFFCSFSVNMVKGCPVHLFSAFVLLVHFYGVLLYLIYSCGFFPCCFIVFVWFLYFFSFPAFMVLWVSFVSFLFCWFECLSWMETQTMLMWQVGDINMPFRTASLNGPRFSLSHSQTHTLSLSHYPFFLSIPLSQTYIQRH